MERGILQDCPKHSSQGPGRWPPTRCQQDAIPMPTTGKVVRLRKVFDRTATIARPGDDVSLHQKAGQTRHDDDRHLSPQPVSAATRRLFHRLEESRHTRTHSRHAIERLDRVQDEVQ